MLEYISLYFKELLYLCNEMSPYLLLGFVFAGILHVYVKQERITKYLGKPNFKSSLRAALIGVPLPLCSCGVIPTGVSIQKNGASKGAAVSFLISTPQTGVDSMLMTYSMLGLPFAIVRPLVAFVTGVLGGVFTNYLDKSPETQAVDNHNFKSNIPKENKFRKFFTYAFVDFLQDISKWLIIGLLLAALISVLLPDDFFSEYINSPILGMLIVLAISVPLYVCATGSVPIAAVLMMKGLSPGAAFVFLMAGPATNAATIAVIGKSMGKTVLTAYLASIIGGALIFGLIIDYLFPVGFFSSGMSHDHGAHAHDTLPYWFQLSSTVALGLLIINGYVQKFRTKEIHTEHQNTEKMEFIKINVNGMTCNHCKANVEKNIGKIAGITAAVADITKNTVEISGETINLNQISTLINDLGYEFAGTTEK